MGARQVWGREGEGCTLKTFMLQINMCFKPVTLQIFI